MTLPTSRNTNYAPGAQIKSSDLNDIQDKIIAQWALSATNIRTAFIGVQSFTLVAGFTMNASTPYVECPASTIGTIYCPLPAEVGHRIHAINVLCSCAAVAANMAASLRYVTAASGGAVPGAEVTVGTINTSAAVATIQKIVLTPPTPPHVVVADRNYYCRIQAISSAGTKQAYRVEYVFDRAP